MEMGTTPPPPDEVIDSIEVDNANDPTLIDCTTSPRVFIRILGNQYPIWKPSDGDGPDTGSGDIWGAMLLPPLDQRWKVFQVRFASSPYPRAQSSHHHRHLES